MSDPKVGAITFGPQPVALTGVPPRGLHPAKRDTTPTPAQRSEMFAALEPGSQIVPASPLADIVQASIAISLKRIADHFEKAQSLKRIADHLDAQRQVSDELRKEISR